MDVRTELEYDGYCSFISTTDFTYLGNTYIHSFCFSSRCVRHITFVRPDIISWNRLRNGLTDPLYILRIISPSYRIYQDWPFSSPSGSEIRMVIGTFHCLMSFFSYLNLNTFQECSLRCGISTSGFRLTSIHTMGLTSTKQAQAPSLQITV